MTVRGAGDEAIAYSVSEFTLRSLYPVLRGGIQTYLDQNQATEFLARFDDPGVSNGPTECLNLKVKNTQAHRTWLPVVRQLQTATTSQPRTHQR